MFWGEVKLALLFEARAGIALAQNFFRKWIFRKGRAKKLDAECVKTKDDCDPTLDVSPIDDARKNREYLSSIGF